MPTSAILLLLALAAQPPAKAAPARAEGEGPWAKLILRGANLIDGTGGPLRGPVDIVIENNRIAQIVDVGFPNVPIDPKKRPQGAAKEIDVAGMYVLPGFVDLHLHIEDGTKAPRGRVRLQALDGPRHHQRPRRAVRRRRLATE